MERFDTTARITTGSLFVAPALLFASTLVFLGEGGINDGEVGGTIQIYAMGVMCIAVVALTGALRETAPRAAGVLLASGLLGAASGVGFGVESIWVAMTGEPQLIETGTNIGFLSSLPGLVFPVTFIAIGVLYARTGVVAPALGVALAIAGALFPAGRASDIAGFAIATDLVFLVVFAAIGRQLWTAPTTTVRGTVAPQAS